MYVECKGKINWNLVRCVFQDWKLLQERRNIEIAEIFRHAV